MTLPLVSVWPSLRGRFEHVALGSFPTPIARLAALEAELSSRFPLYAKRDDLSSVVYGGNKVRTLEVLFALARARGAREILATGAFGSNHAVATVLHAPRAELEAGALLFPQPRSQTALENVRVTTARARFFAGLWHWSALPYAIWRARSARRAIMPPGGATPDGALGYVSAALELADQIRRGELEPPAAIYVGVGSTCTTAGLLVGLKLASRIGLGLTKPPTVVAVRVTPWPVTSRFRILRLAEGVARRLSALALDDSLALSVAELSPLLEVDGRELGRGYGIPTPSGARAIETFRRLHALELDSTYSAKSAAAFLRAAEAPPTRGRAPGPLLFWSTKSTAPLPTVEPEELRDAPAVVRRWIARAEREQGMPF